MFTNGIFLIIVPFGSVLAHSDRYAQAGQTRRSAPTVAWALSRAATRSAPTMGGVGRTGRTIGPRGGPGRVRDPAGAVP